MWRTSTGPSGTCACRIAARSAEDGPQHQRRDDHERDRDDHDVAAALRLRSERVEAHTATVAAVSDLLVDRDDGVVTLTLNRPDKKNAITGSMWGGLREVFEDVANNGDDRVLVVTGAG